MTVITIYCDGPTDAPHPRYVIDQYQHHRVGDQLAWLPLEQWSYRGATGRTAQVTQRHYIGDTPQQHTPDVTDDQFRMRFALRCPKCKFDQKRDMGRGTDVMAELFDTFDRMTDAGADEIPIRLLAQLIFR